MADYTELFAIMSNSVAGAQTLRDKVASAVLITAELILNNGDTAAPFDQAAGKHDLRVKWADMAVKNWLGTANEVTRVVVAANDTATQTAILNASDASILSSVESIIDALSANLV